MPTGHSDVHTWHNVHSPVFLTLKKANEFGIFKKAPQGQINLQNPFFPKKYTIKNPSIKNVNIAITNPGRKAHISGAFSFTIISFHGFNIAFTTFGAI